MCVELTGQKGLKEVLLIIFFILLWNTIAFLFHSPGFALVVVAVVVVLVVAVVEGVPANCCSPSSPPSTPCRLPVFSAPPPLHHPHSCTTPTLSLPPLHPHPTTTTTTRAPRETGSPQCPSIHSGLKARQDGDRTSLAREHRRHPISAQAAVQKR